MPRIESKIGKIVVVVFITLYLLLGFYVVVKPGWKEYKGDGFSIKYPPSFSYHLGGTSEAVGLSSIGRQTLLYIGNTKRKLNDPEYVDMVINRYTKSEINDFDKLIQENYNMFSKTNSISKTNIQISKNKTVVFVINGNSKGYEYPKTYFYWIDSGKYIYEIFSTTLVDRPLWKANYYDYITTLVAGSFRIF